jgi:hypothetical protein
MTPELVFQRQAVRPVECIKGAWAVVKDQFWLFVGMCVVALLIAWAVPLGILLGPMMAGFYVAFFKARRGEPIEFGTLFKGFDFFGPSLVATLLHVLPIVAIVVPAYLFFYVGMVVSIASQGNSDEPNPAAFFGVFGFFIFVWIAIILLIIVISIGFSFTYPLIVDRKLSGFDAVKWSFKAAMSNFWRLLGMTFLTGLLAMCGMLLCYVGMFLVIPISYGALAIAYEQVFGLSRPSEVVSNLPPPPPSF